MVGSSCSKPESDSSLQIFLPLSFLESLDRIAQHGSRHGATVLSEKSFKRRLVFLAGFAQRPAASFMNEIFFIFKQHLRKVQSVMDMALSNKPERRHHGDPPVPDAGRAGELIKQAFIPLQKVSSDDIWRAVIYPIPAMNGIAMPYVEVEDLLSFPFAALLNFQRRMA